MSNRNTSRVFEIQRQAKARLVAQSWPVSPSGVTPTITYDVAARPDANAELIIVATNVGDDSLIEWTRMPQCRDEDFDLVMFIVVKPAGPGMAGEAPDAEERLLDRLEELADVLQRAFFDDTETTIGGRNKPLPIDEMSNLSAIRQVTSEIARQSDGLIGQVVATYGAKFRI